MKKTTILAAVFILCGQVLSAENPLDEGTLSVHQNLTKEPLQTQNYEEKIQSLTEQLDQEKGLSTYFKTSFRDIGVFGLSLQLLGVGACALKIISFIQEYNFCRDKDPCSVICPRNPFDFQALIRTPKSSVDICLLNAGAESLAYITAFSVIVFTFYCTYKFVNGPEVNKYKMS